MAQGLRCYSPHLNLYSTVNCTEIQAHLKAQISPKISLLFLFALLPFYFFTLWAKGKKSRQFAQTHQFAGIYVKPEHIGSANM